MADPSLRAVGSDSSPPTSGNEYVTDLVAKKLVEQMQKDTTRYFDGVWQVRLAD